MILFNAHNTLMRTNCVTSLQMGELRLCVLQRKELRVCALNPCTPRPRLSHQQQPQLLFSFPWGHLESTLPILHTLALPAFEAAFLSLNLPPSFPFFLFHAKHCPLSQFGEFLWTHSCLPMLFSKHVSFPFGTF